MAQRRAAGVSGFGDAILRDVLCEPVACGLGFLYVAGGCAHPVRTLRGARGRNFSGYLVNHWKGHALGRLTSRPAASLRAFSIHASNCFATLTYSSTASSNSLLASFSNGVCAT